MKRDFEIRVLFSVDSDLSSHNIINRITREFNHNIDGIKFEGSTCGEIDDAKDMPVYNHKCDNTCKWYDGKYTMTGLGSTWACDSCRIDNYDNSVDD